MQKKAVNAKGWMEKRPKRDTVDAASPMASQFAARDAVRPLESAVGPLSFSVFVFAAERPSAQIDPAPAALSLSISNAPSVHSNPLFAFLRERHWVVVLCLLDIYFAAVWLGVLVGFP